MSCVEVSDAGDMFGSDKWDPVFQKHKGKSTNGLFLLIKFGKIYICFWSDMMWHINLIGFSGCLNSEHLIRLLSGNLRVESIHHGVCSLARLECKRYLY